MEGKASAFSFAFAESSECLAATLERMRRGVVRCRSLERVERGLVRGRALGKGCGGEGLCTSIVHAGVSGSLQ